MCTERLGTTVWSPYGEVWSYDVFVSFCGFVIECYNMYDTTFKEISHTMSSRATVQSLSCSTTYSQPGVRPRLPALLVEFGVGVVRMLQHRDVVHRMRRVRARVVHIWQRFGAVVLRAVRHRQEKVGFRCSMC